MKFNAKKAEHEYVTTNISYRELAEKHEVSLSYMATVGSKNKWGEKRKDYRTNVYKKSIEKSEKADIDKLADCKTATDKAIAIVIGMINDCEEGTPQDMRTCVAALKDLIGMQRDLHGILTKKDELTLLNTDSDDGESGIVYIPPLAPEADAVVIEGDNNA